ncbi:hypothetical protein [Mycolicibacterium celeriflavum]|uniref:hypothetical protein n=1 Tax=Mycolicibacterium celeriflavum TaxID=1249101 RepID=UPI003CF83F29
MALLAVIGVTAAVTISVTSDSEEDRDPAPSGETYGLASADDTGPVNIITDDASCAAWGPINDTFADITKKVWNKRDPSVPATRWTPEQRAVYEDVGSAASDAADRTVPLAKLTPHRAMREMYEQFIAYARAYSELIPDYVPRDDHVSGAMITLAGALTYVCSALEWRSAQARAPLITAPEPPKALPPLTDPSDPRRFLLEADATCPTWGRLLDDFDADTKQWQALDSNLPAGQWTAEQRAIVDAVVPVMEKLADDIEATGLRSSNPHIRDFAALAAQYRRAYAAALPTYTPADSYLATASLRITSTLYEACAAVGDE